MRNDGKLYRTVKKLSEIKLTYFSMIAFLMSSPEKSDRSTTASVDDVAVTDMRRRMEPELVHFTYHFMLNS